MPTPKYRNMELDPIDGRPLYWSTHPGGLPVRQGDSPTMVDQHQLMNASVNLYFESQVLEIPKDLERYNRIWDWVANGLAIMKDEKVVPVPDRPGNWFVWISWAHVRGHIPKSVAPTDMG